MALTSMLLTRHTLADNISRCRFDLLQLNNYTALHHCAANNDVDGALYLSARGADVFGNAPHFVVRPIQLMNDETRRAIISRVSNWNRRSAIILCLYGASLLAGWDNEVPCDSSQHVLRVCAVRVLTNSDLVRHIMKFI